MITHILDTDVLTLFQHGHLQVASRCVGAPPFSLAISVISVEEQFLGWHTRIRQAKRDDEVALGYDGMTAFASFIKVLPVISLSAGAILRYRQLKAFKIKVGKKDLCIAAIALEQNAVVVTRNISDFGRVPGLSVEDWTK